MLIPHGGRLGVPALPIAVQPPGGGIAAHDQTSQRSVDEEFFALVLADPELLEAEFNALVADQLEPPGTGDHWRVRTRPAGPHGSRRRRGRTVDGRWPPRSGPARTNPTRQRSPPRRMEYMRPLNPGQGRR